MTNDPSPLPNDRPPSTILIVEDDPKNRKLLSDLLTLKGYEVLSASNGTTGVETARTRRPSLILMDIQMPVMDGFEATRLIKNDPRSRAIPIWALTAYAMRDDEKRIRAEGCDDYLTKPLDLNDLLNRIQRHFEKQGARP